MVCMFDKDKVDRRALLLLQKVNMLELVKMLTKLKM